MNLTSVYVKLIALGAIITALGAFHYIDKGYAVKEAENALKARYELQMAKANAKAVLTQEDLRRDAKQREKDKDDEIAAINGKLAVALNRLSNRPTRPPNYSPTPEAGKACSGSELYREDGEFLTREAARAEALIVERDYYYEQYEHARTELAKQAADDR